MQDRTLRFVYDDFVSSYGNLLDEAEVLSLQTRRLRTMVIKTYKIVNKVKPVCLHNSVHLKVFKYSFRHSNILDIPRVHTTKYGKKSFKFAAATW